MDEQVIEKLEKLGSLLEKGILTKEEFQHQKAMLLAPAAPSASASAPVPLPVAPMPAPVPAPTDTAAPVAPGSATETSLEVMRRRARSFKTAGAVAFVGGFLAFYVGTFAEGQQQIGFTGALVALGGLGIFIMGRLQE